MLNFSAFYWHGTKAEKKKTFCHNFLTQHLVTTRRALLEELESKCDKINSIDGMGNEP
jgi:hypothetical protein